MTTLQELIARLEKATGPDRALDSEIGAAVGLHGWTPAEWVRVVTELYRDYPKHPAPVMDKCPEYTFSIDQAMTLLPTNWTGCLDGIGSHGVIARFGPPASDAEFSGEHSSTAIALCICILKSREAANA